ncbi:hypothetical protein HK104_004756 [Borealophlyctis nickersoniae]|nr:hypothetical protein HK104_004756 [Borealophlyctis nickersoniae]
MSSYGTSPAPQYTYGSGASASGSGYGVGGGPSAIPTTTNAFGVGDAADLTSAQIPITPTPVSVSGNMAPPPGVASIARPTVDTLDEPVSATIMRDLRSIWGKMKQ